MVLEKENTLRRCKNVFIKFKIRKMEIIIISITSTLILTTLVWIIFFKNIQNKLTNQNDKLSTELDNIKGNINYQVEVKLNEKVHFLNEQILDLKNKCIVVEIESYKKGRKEASEEFEKDYFVDITAYKDVWEEGGDFIIFNTKKKFVEVGFKRQLYIKGIPAFDPVYISIDTYKYEDFSLNEAAITKLVNNTISLMAPEASFIKVANNVLNENRQHKTD